MSGTVDGGSGSVGGRLSDYGARGSIKVIREDGGKIGKNANLA